MAGFARICVFLATLLIYNFLVNAGLTTTRVVIGQDGQLVCNTRNEQIRWTVDGKNVTKGSNKRYEPAAEGVGRWARPFFSLSIVPETAFRIRNQPHVLLHLENY